MATLTTAEKAPLNCSDGPILAGGPYSIGTSAGGVASFAIGDLGSPVYVVGQTAGEATITVVRLADGATATLDVEVTAGPFTISLGAPVPK